MGASQGGHLSVVQYLIDNGSEVTDKSSWVRHDKLLVYIESFPHIFINKSLPL